MGRERGDIERQRLRLEMPEVLGEAVRSGSTDAVERELKTLGQE